MSSGTYPIIAQALPNPAAGIRSATLYRQTVSVCRRTFMMFLGLIHGRTSWLSSRQARSLGRRFSGLSSVRPKPCAGLLWHLAILLLKLPQPPLQEPDSRWCTGNFLVCLAMWQATAAQDIIGKIFGIFFPVSAFVSMSFSHVVCLQARMIFLLS